MAKEMVYVIIGSIAVAIALFIIWYLFSKIGWSIILKDKDEGGVIKWSKDRIAFFCTFAVWLFVILFIISAAIFNIGVDVDSSLIGLALNNLLGGMILFAGSAGFHKLTKTGQVFANFKYLGAGKKTAYKPYTDPQRPQKENYVPTHQKQEKTQQEASNEVVEGNDYIRPSDEPQ